jgi:hypothetical protein
MSMLQEVWGLTHKNDIGVCERWTSNNSHNKHKLYMIFLKYWSTYYFFKQINNVVSCICCSEAGCTYNDVSRDATRPWT